MSEFSEPYESDPVRELHILTFINTVLIPMLSDGDPSVEQLAEALSSFKEKNQAEFSLVEVQQELSERLLSLTTTPNDPYYSMYANALDYLHLQRDLGSIDNGLRGKNGYIDY